MTSQESFTEFFNKWKTIEHTLKLLSKSGNSESWKHIEEASDRKIITSLEKSQLNTIREIRNEYAHHPNIEKWVSLTPACNIFLEEIIQKLQKSANIENFDIKDFVSCSPIDLVKEKLKLMRKNGYTHLPILNAEKKVIGVLSDDAIVNYLLKNEIATLDQEKIENLLEFTKISEGPIDRSEDFPFISRRKSLLDVKEYLSRNISAQKRISLFLITEDGKKDQPLLSIFTVWDFFKNGIH